jgi:hypothetical protein
LTNLLRLLFHLSPFFPAPSLPQFFIWTSSWSTLFTVVLFDVIPHLLWNQKFQKTKTMMILYNSNNTDDANNVPSVLIEIFNII